MSIDTREHAILAEDSYEDRSEYIGKGSIKIQGIVYEILDTKIDSITGYQGTIYRRVDTGEVIVAHRGSEFDRELLKDGILADGGMVLTGLNAQAQEAEAFTKHAIELAKQASEVDGKPLQITVTGHSLGGALAELTAYKFHLHAETFNAYGAADLGYYIPQGGGSVINYVRATDVVSAASHHFGKVVVIATADDIRQLEHNGYHEHATMRNPLGAINFDAHSITNFVDQPGRPSDLTAENEARARAYEPSISLYREDMHDLRANVFSLAWRLEQKKETAMALGGATATALLHGDRDAAERLANLATHRAADNLQHAAHVVTNTAMFGITAIDQTDAYVADNIKQGMHALNQAAEPMTRAIDQAGAHITDHVKHDIQQLTQAAQPHIGALTQSTRQLAQSAQQTVQPFVQGVAHYSNAARGVPLPPAPQDPVTTAQAEPSPEEQMLQELQCLQEQLNRLQSQYMPEHAVPPQREQAQPIQERGATTPSHVDVSQITPHSSIDDMFEAFHQASVVDDRTALSAVTQAYQESPHGQAWLQSVRDYNEQLERQQILEQQMARRGPSMSR